MNQKSTFIEKFETQHLKKVNTKLNTITFYDRNKTVKAII